MTTPFVILLSREVSQSIHSAHCDLDPLSNILCAVTGGVWKLHLHLGGLKVWHAFNSFIVQNEQNVNKRQQKTLAYTCCILAWPSGLSKQVQAALMFLLFDSFDHVAADVPAQSVHRISYKGCYRIGTWTYLHPIHCIVASWNQLLMRSYQWCSLRPGSGYWMGSQLRGHVPLKRWCLGHNTAHFLNAQLMRTWLDWVMRWDFCTRHMYVKNGNMQWPASGWLGLLEHCVQVHFHLLHSKDQGVDFLIWTSSNTLKALKKKPGPSCFSFSHLGTSIAITAIWSCLTGQLLQPFEGEAWVCWSSERSRKSSRPKGTWGTWVASQHGAAEMYSEI